MLQKAFLILFLFSLTLPAFSQCEYNNIYLNEIDRSIESSMTFEVCMYPGSYITLKACKPGETIKVSTCSSIAEVDTRITVYSENGEQFVAYDDDGCGIYSTLSELYFTPEEVTSFDILLDQYDALTETYIDNFHNCVSLNIEIIPDNSDKNCGYNNLFYSSVEAPEINEPVSYNCINAGEFIRVKGLKAGNTYFVKTYPSLSMDTRLSIYKTENEILVAENDDYYGTRAALRFTPDESGDYDILVDEYDSYLGCKHNLNECVALSIANEYSHFSYEIPYDNNFYAEIEAPGEKGQNSYVNYIYGGEYITLTHVIAGNTYRIASCGTEYDTWLSVFTQYGGQLLAFNNDNCGVQSEVYFTANYSGNFDILIDEYIAEEVGLQENSIYSQLQIELIDNPLSAMVNSDNSSGMGNEISIYPNPSNKLIQIDINKMNNFEDASIVVTNIHGAELKEYVLQNEAVAQVDVSSLSPGMYHINVLTRFSKSTAVFSVY